MSKAVLKLLLDTTAFDVAIKNMVRLRPTLTDDLLEILQTFFDRVEAGDEIVYVVSGPVLAPNTVDLVFSLDLSDSFRGLVAAMGATNG